MGSAKTTEEAVVMVQAGHKSGQDQGDKSGGGKKWSGSEYTLLMDQTLV